jgi:hypothetical protein
MLEHLNNLNVILQGKHILVPEVYTAIRAFKTKLFLFTKQVKEYNFTHLPTLQRINVRSSAANAYSNIHRKLCEFCQQFKG